MRRWWLLGLLAACETAPAPCEPCDLAAPSCAAGETCVGDPELGSGSCTASDATACEAPIDIGDGKSDASALPHQHIDIGSGRVLHSIQLWTIAWHVDAQLAADVDRFHQWMLQSGYWKSSLAEYGVGAGRSMGVIVLASPPPAAFTDALPEQIMKQLIASGRLPPANPQTAYSFIVPAATSTPPGTGGYHAVLPNIGTPYEVMTHSLAADGSVDFDQLTYSYAHETAELATDPFVDAWGSAGFFRENGDMCNNLSRRTAPVAPPSGGTPRSYKISRLFSNVRAAQGLDPCVPTRAGAEYRGVVVTPITATVALGPRGNGATTMTLRAFSSDPNVTHVRWHAEFVNADPHVTVQPMQGVAMIGTPVTLHVTARVASPAPYGIAIDFITDVPDPTNSDWNSGEVSQWNALLDVH